jgi:peptidoglycan hydrolase-like protein with peptidoglycan-binding domain
MADEPELGPGDSGEWVTYLQTLLAHHGQPVDADGTFADTTTKALHAFQQAKGLDTTDRTNPGTWAALTGEAAPTGSNTASPGGGVAGGGGAAKVWKTIDPGQFQTFFAFWGMQGADYVAALGIDKPSEDHDTEYNAFCTAATATGSALSDVPADVFAGAIAEASEAKVTAAINKAYETVTAGGAYVDSMEHAGKHDDAARLREQMAQLYREVYELDGLCK